MVETMSTSNIKTNAHAKTNDAIRKSLKGTPMRSTDKLKLKTKPSIEQRRP